MPPRYPGQLNLLSGAQRLDKAAYPRFNNISGTLKGHFIIIIRVLDIQVWAVSPAKQEGGLDTGVPGFQAAKL